MNITKCDICAEIIGDPGALYQVSRHDEYGPLGGFEVCSAECLAVVAVKDANERGAADEHRAVTSKLASAPKKTRKWWSR